MSTPPEPAPTPGPRRPAWSGDRRRLRRRARHHPPRSPRSRSVVGAVHGPRLPLDPQVKAALVLDPVRFRGASCCRCCGPWPAAADPGRPVSHAGAPRADVVVAAAPADLLRPPPFVSPQANFLILRHFHLGSNVVAVPGRELGDARRELPLRPLEPADVKDDVFLQHDLNLYNFVISLNTALAAEDRGLSPPARIDFDAIDEAPDPVPAVSARAVQLSRLDLGDRALHAALSPAARAARLRAREPVAAARRDRRHLRGPDPGRHHPPRAGQQPPPVGAAVVAARRLPPGAARARHRDAARRAGPAQARRRLRRASRTGGVRQRRRLRLAEPLARTRRRVTALLDVHVERLPLALVFAITVAVSCSSTSPSAG